MPNLFPKLSIAIAYVALSTAVAIKSQASTTINHDFTVNVTSGSLAGKSFNGTFSYDNSTLKNTGIEELGIAQGLKVCMNYFGRNYSETDDTSYPTFPKLIFDNGKLKQLDFWVQPNKRANWWNMPGWEVKVSMRKASATVQNCQRR
jgi:hypothetical protein